MKVRIAGDEWYPVYSVVEKYGHEVEATDEQITRWRAAHEAFAAAQEEMSELYGAAEEAERERLAREKAEREAAEEAERRRVADGRRKAAAEREAKRQAAWDKINAADGMVYDADGNPIGSLTESGYGVRLDPS